MPPDPRPPSPDPSAKRVLILANPYSGSGPNRRRVAELAEHLDGAGLTAEVVWERDRHAELLASHADVPLRCVIAAGGDGSIGGILDAMRDADRLHVPFATLPVGNENLFARQFGFDRRHPEAIAAAVARGETRSIDLGEADGRVFHLMASAGFDAEVVRRVDAWRTTPTDGSLKRVHRLKYAVPMLKAAAAYRHPRVTLEADGQTVEGSLAFVFNLPQYGGNLLVCGQAEPDDGLLDWVVFQARRPAPTRPLRRDGAGPAAHAKPRRRLRPRRADHPPPPRRAGARPTRRRPVGRYPLHRQRPARER